MTESEAMRVLGQNLCEDMFVVLMPYGACTAFLYMEVARYRQQNDPESSQLPFVLEKGRKGKGGQSGEKEAGEELIIVVID
jgi:hypothetical protein